jgi:hypothetical protein
MTLPEKVGYDPSVEDAEKERIWARGWNACLEECKTDIRVKSYAIEELRSALSGVMGDLEIMWKQTTPTRLINAHVAYAKYVLAKFK